MRNQESTRPYPHGATGTPEPSFRFDWYEVTFDGADEDQVAFRLSMMLGAKLARGKGRNGYASCWAVVRGDDELVRVYGGASREGEVHLTVTGQSCDELVPIIRDLWPVHRVSRADVSLDVAADFLVMDAVAVDFAKDKGVKYRLVTDSDGGATRYLGSPTSEASVRVYKKTEQLRALCPARADEVPEGIVRVEMQMRPGKRDTKERAATMQPAEYWGFARWTQALADQMLGVDAERVATHHRRPSDWNRFLVTLTRQYSPAVLRRVAETQDRETVIREVLDALGLSDESTPF